MAKELTVRSENADLVEKFKRQMGGMLDMSDNQKNRLKKKLKNELSCWKDDTSEQHTMLERWNNLMENIVEDTNEPWEGASNIHIPVVAIYCKVYHSVERRSILGAGNIWYATTTDDNLKDQIAKIESYANYKAFNDWNIAEFLSEAFWCTNRDGLGIGKIEYDLETEDVFDKIYIADLESFMQEFPDPDSGGLSPEEWDELRAEAAISSEEDPLEIDIKETQIKYQGPRGTVVEYANFIILPATAISLEKRHARGYGERFTLRRGELKSMAKEFGWDKEEVEKLLSGKSSGSIPTSYQRSKEWAVGIGRTKNTDEYELYSLVYWCDLNKDGEEEKLMVVYSLDKDCLLAVKPYNLRTDSYVLFRISKKTNQLTGDSVVGGLTDLNDEVDALHNQRINSRRITEVPSFIAKYALKGKFDPYAEENRFRPGVCFWLEDIEGFKQMLVQPVDLGTSMQEESNDFKLCSLWAGLDPFIYSGNASPDDPNAPANKTLMLIQQSNMRMDDPLMELRQSVNKVGDICVALEYQFGNQILEYQNGEGKGAVMDTFPKRLLRKGIKMNMRGITVALNPEAEFAKWINYYKLLMTEPVIAQNVSRRVESLRMALRNGRIENRDKILPSMEELQREDDEAKARVLLIAQQQQQAQAVQQQTQVVQQAESNKQEMIKGILQKAKQLKTINELKAAGNGGQNVQIEA